MRCHASTRVSAAPRRHSAAGAGTLGSARGTITDVRGAGPHLAEPGERAENAFMSPRRKVSEKSGALSDHQRLIRQFGVTPLIYQYGETVIRQPGEMARELGRSTLTPAKKSRRKTARGLYVVTGSP